MLAKIQTATSVGTFVLQSTWGDPSTLVSLLSFFGTVSVSLLLVFLMRKTNHLQQEFRDWQQEQISPNLQAGTFSLLRFMDGPTLRLQGVLLNPGSTSIHLTHGIMRFEDSPKLHCSVVFHDKQPEERTIPGYGYLWLGSDFYIQHSSIRAESYWPNSITLSISYVSGGEAKDWTKRLHRAKIVDETGWYVEREDE